MTELEYAGTTYYLIGTAHVSQASVDEVRRAIAELAPDVVCVELCKARLASLTGETTFRDLDVVAAVREGRAMFLLAQLALGAYQRKLGRSLNVKPGAELLAAVMVARERGIEVALIDRDVGITMRRTWANLGVAKRAMLAASLLVAAVKSETITAEAVENLKDKRNLDDVMAELAKALPEIKGPLIDERDQYLASKMVEAGSGRRRVVVVIGAAHVAGVTANLGHEIDRVALERTPAPKRGLRNLLRPLFLVALMALGLRAGASLPAVWLAWVVPTAIAGAAATLAAGGSLGALLAAALAGPIAALHPSWTPGQIVGVIEARVRRPETADRDAIGDDTATLRGFLRNGATRILVISVASSLGARLGLSIGMVRLFTLL